MNAVHPNSELGQELVKSWRVGRVGLPIGPSLERLKGGEEDKGEAEGRAKGKEEM